MQLNQSIPSSNPALEFRLEWVQFFPFLMPHEFNVANRAGVVEQQKEVLEEFQILLELAPQRSTQDIVLLFHAGHHITRDCITGTPPKAS